MELQDLKGELDIITIRLTKIDLDLQTIYRDLQQLLSLTRLINGQLPAPAED